MLVANSLIYDKVKLKIMALNDDLTKFKVASEGTALFQLCVSS
jgi:hypothetical protein